MTMRMMELPSSYSIHKQNPRTSTGAKSNDKDNDNNNSSSVLSSVPRDVRGGGRNGGTNGGRISPSRSGSSSVGSHVRCTQQQQQQKQQQKQKQHFKTESCSTVSDMSVESWSDYGRHNNVKESEDGTNSNKNNSNKRRTTHNQTATTTSTLSAIPSVPSYASLSSAESVSASTVSTLSTKEHIEAIVFSPILTESPIRINKPKTIGKQQPQQRSIFPRLLRCCRSEETGSPTHCQDPSPRRRLLSYEDEQELTAKLHDMFNNPHKLQDYDDGQRQDTAVLDRHQQYHHDQSLSAPSVSTQQPPHNNNSNNNNNNPAGILKCPKYTTTSTERIVPGRSSRSANNGSSGSALSYKKNPLRFMNTVRWFCGDRQQRRQHQHSRQMRQWNNQRSQHQNTNQQSMLTSEAVVGGTSTSCGDDHHHPPTKTMASSAAVSRTPSNRRQTVTWSNVPSSTSDDYSENPSQLRHINHNRTSINKTGRSSSSSYLTTTTSSMSDRLKARAMMEEKRRKQQLQQHHQQQRKIHDNASTDVSRNNYQSHHYHPPQWEQRQQQDHELESSRSSPTIGLMTSSSTVVDVEAEETPYTPMIINDHRSNGDRDNTNDGNDNHTRYADGNNTIVRPILMRNTTPTLSDYSSNITIF